MDDTDFYVNKYPPGSEYIFLIVFILFGVNYLLRRRLANRFFSKKWCDDTEKFSQDSLLKNLKEFNLNTKYGFHIQKFTTVYLNGRPTPVIYADINHPGIFSTGRSTSKGFVTFSDLEAVHKLYADFTDIFEYCCENTPYKVYLIKNVKKLEELLKSQKFES